MMGPLVRKILILIPIVLLFVVPMAPFSVKADPAVGRLLNLNAYDLLPYNYTANAPLFSWSDAATNNTFVVRSGWVAPLYKPNTLNGKPVVNFSSGARMIVTSTLGVSSSSARTFVVVARLNDMYTRSPLFVQGEDNSGTNYAGLDANSYNTAGGRFGIYNQGQTYDTVTFSDSQFHIHTLIFDDMSATNISVRYFIDGTQVGLDARYFASGSGLPNSNITSMGSFASALLSQPNFDIAQVQVWGRALDTVDRQLVEYNAGQYWGLVASPPDATPTPTPALPTATPTPALPTATPTPTSTPVPGIPTNTPVSGVACAVPYTYLVKSNLEPGDCTPWFDRDNLGYNYAKSSSWYVSPNNSLDGVNTLLYVSFVVTDTSVYAIRYYKSGCAHPYISTDVTNPAVYTDITYGSFCSDGSSIIAINVNFPLGTNYLIFDTGGGGAHVYFDDITIRLFSAYSSDPVSTPTPVAPGGTTVDPRPNIDALGTILQQIKTAINTGLTGLGTLITTGLTGLGTLITTGLTGLGTSINLKLDELKSALLAPLNATLLLFSDLIDGGLYFLGKIGAILQAIISPLLWLYRVGSGVIANITGILASAPVASSLGTLFAALATSVFFQFILTMVTGGLWILYLVYVFKSLQSLA